MRALRDRYGFLFWLRWIAAFAGSFVVSAVAWTALFARVFGPIEGEEIMVSWTVSVFGTWFILVIPFMRKKEQIWKRLNTDQEKSVDAWLAGFGMFLAAFVLSAFGWSFIFKERATSGERGFDPVWAKAVFSTWLAILVPLLIWMYRSADRIFRQAHERQTREPGFQTFWVDPGKRLLPAPLAEKLSRGPSTLPGGHLVRGRLKDGKRIGPLFVLHGKEVVGAYGFQPVDFDASELVDLEILDPTAEAIQDESLWVRFNISS